MRVGRGTGGEAGREGEKLEPQGRDVEMDEARWFESSRLRIRSDHVRSQTTPVGKKGKRGLLGTGGKRKGNGERVRPVRWMDVWLELAPNGEVGGGSDLGWLVLINCLHSMLRYSTAASVRLP
jgi:hypothetical protein